MKESLSGLADMPERWFLYKKQSVKGLNRGLNTDTRMHPSGGTLNQRFFNIGKYNIKYKKSERNIRVGDRRVNKKGLKARVRTRALMPHNELENDISASNLLDLFNFRGRPIN